MLGSCAALHMPSMHRIAALTGLEQAGLCVASAGADGNAIAGAGLLVAALREGARQSVRGGKLAVRREQAGATAGTQEAPGLADGQTPPGVQAAWQGSWLAFVGAQTSQRDRGRPGGVGCRTRRPLHARCASSPRVAPRRSWGAGLGRGDGGRAVRHEIGHLEQGLASEQGLAGSPSHVCAGPGCGVGLQCGGGSGRRQPHARRHSPERSRWSLGSWSTRGRGSAEGAGWGRRVPTPAVSPPQAPAAWRGALGCARAGRSRAQEPQHSAAPPFPPCRPRSGCWQ